MIGIDEAGRGPLAGPVAVGAVLIPSHFDWKTLEGVKDSKQLRPQVRERIFHEMQELKRMGKLHFAVAFSSHAIIDRKGIIPAIRSALKRTLVELAREFLENRHWNFRGDSLEEVAEVLLDGGLSAPISFRSQQTIIRGDQSEPAISLASIAAKVLRDRHMSMLAERYPQYGFEEHKGYGTPDHARMIRKNGLCAIHRITFCSNLVPGSAKKQVSSDKYSLRLVA